MYNVISVYELKPVFRLKKNVKNMIDVAFPLHQAITQTE